MRASVLACVAGMAWLQQQAELPLLHWAWLLLPGIALVVALSRLPAIPPIVVRMMLVGVAAGAGFFWAAACAHWRLADALPAEWEGRDIRVAGVVADLPQIGEDGVRFTFDVEQVLTEGAAVPERILLTWYNERRRPGKALSPEAAPRRPNAGERWQMTVRLKRPHGSVNPHGFDFERWALERRIRATGYVRSGDGTLRLAEQVDRPTYRIARLRQTIRERHLAALPGYDHAGVLVALAVGDQRAIPRTQWQVFTRTGVNHLMSISGLHVTMVSGLVFALAYGLWRRSHLLLLWLPARKAAVIAGLAAAFGYALLAGFEVPAQRTVYMLAAMALALWLGRLASATTVLAWALLCVVVLDPWAVLAPGFWLSFGAVAVIMLVAAGRIGAEHWLSGWVRVQWAITLGLVPLLLAMFQQVSLVSPIANAIAIPLVSLVVVPLTLLATLPFLDILLLPAHMIMHACMEMLQWMGGLPQAVWSQHAPPPWTVGAAMVGIIWMLLPGGLGFGLGGGPRFTSGFPARWLGAVALLPMFLVFPPRPEPGTLWLTVLDVGQGLAVVARTAQHALLFDTGPAFGTGADSGNRIIVPYLRGEGIGHLDVMVVTHADLDHSGGALSVLEAVPVEWLVSSLGVDHPIRRAAARQRPCLAGQSWEWDGVRFDMLHPPPQRDARRKVGSNAGSCVLKVTSAHGSVLLPADIGKQAERRLLKESGEQLAATVLVAPHHGSKTSSSEAFVRQVAPGLVIFTVGYRNRFGHPREEVVERYRRQGSTLLRSDQDGAILLRFMGGVPAVRRARTLYPRYWQADPSASSPPAPPAASWPR